jgi:hypothetical protein
MKRLAAILKNLGLALLVGLAGILVFATVSLHIEKWGWNYMNTRHEDWGLFGDYIGGVIGTILTSATLFYLIRQDSKTKKRQLKEDAAKRIQEVMSLHRSVLAAVKMHAYEGRVAIPKEGVEGMWRLYAGHYIPSLHAKLFSLAQQHASSDDHSWKDMVRLGSWSYEDIDSKEKFLEKLGWWSDVYMQPSKVFHEIVMLRNLNAITFSLPAETASVASKEVYEMFFQSVGYIFGHYHRNLFYVLQEIDDSPYSVPEKERQAKLFRSMLSGAELVMIHLNIYCGYDKSTSGEYKFRELIQKYRILEDLEMHMFAHREVYLRDGIPS